MAYRGENFGKRGRRGKQSEGTLDLVHVAHKPDHDERTGRPIHPNLAPGKLDGTAARLVGKGLCPACLDTSGQHALGVASSRAAAAATLRADPATYRALGALWDELASLDDGALGALRQRPVGEVLPRFAREPAVADAFLRNLML